MCGFAGFFSNDKLDTNNILRDMGMAIAHRGPDDMGIWFDDEIGVGFCHRRLSIIDLSIAGAQPMESNSGRYMLVFNGEIYNYQEIRDELEKSTGLINWRGHSDTEIILAGMEFWGVEVTLKKMLGMFAIALWDKEDQQLTIARDRMGEKPLYYGWQKNTFLFASELKALHKHPGFLAEIDLVALASYFKYNYVPADKCIYKGIKKLRPGTFCVISFKNQTVNDFIYWEFKETAARKGNAEILVPELDELLTDAIGKQMIADVPLGAFLSGGVDSSLIVALMQKQSVNPIKTFTIGFNEKQYNEAVYAKEVANHLGTDHTELYVNSEEAMGVIPMLADIYDEPFADSSQIPTYLVSKLAKQKVTVSLSGDAGDELFAGYNRYLFVNNVWKTLSLIPTPVKRYISSFLLNTDAKTLNKIYNKVDFLVPQKYKFANFGDKMHKAAHSLPITSQIELYDGFISHWTPEKVINNYSEHLSYDFDDLKDLSFIEKMMHLDALTYLPDDILVKVDRAAMANSLETRVPFLDYRVVEFANSLPMDFKIKDGKSKWILREILYKYVPKQLIERPKMGFGVPLGEWLRGPLVDWCEDLLSKQSFDKHGLLNHSYVQQKWIEHKSGRYNWQYQIWTVLMFQAWYNKYHG